MAVHRFYYLQRFAVNHHSVRLFTPQGFSLPPLQKYTKSLITQNNMAAQS